MKVICCTMFSPSHQELADISIPNLEEYCLLHGYEMRIINIENDKWEYKKHEAFRDYFKELEAGDIVWYKDIDSIITNLSIPITSFIDDYYPFYLTIDATEFNGGSVIIKNNPAGRKFNAIVLENRDMFENEQNFYNSMPMKIMGMDIMKPIAHPSINSYKYSLYNECPQYVGREDLGDWQPHHLLLHAPALSLEKRAEVLKNAPIIR
jgi:hypothetical protein